MFDDVVLSVFRTGIQVILVFGFLSVLLSLGRDTWNAWFTHA
jgi:hypothetical protein